jgi:chromosome segregation ATPase
MLIPTRSFAPLSLLLAGVLAGGCATPGHARADKTADKLGALRSAVEELQVKVTATSTSLAAVVEKKEKDPGPAFEQLDDDVDALEGALKKAEGRLKGVRKEAEAYFITWKEQAATLNDADLQKRSEARREALASAVEKVEKAMEPARTEIESYLTSLQDTVKYLSIDLTAPGIAGVEGKAKAASKTSTSVNETLAEVLEAVDAARPMFATPRPEPQKAAAPASAPATAVVK